MSSRDTYVDVRDLTGFVKFAVQGANYGNGQSVCHTHTVPVTQAEPVCAPRLGLLGKCERMKCVYK